MTDWARPVVHFEIEAQDPARLRTFYSELFNWKISDGAIIPGGASLAAITDPEGNPVTLVQQ